jgi:hypothetical protein
MRRTTWLAVLTTALFLAVAGNAALVTQIPWSTISSSEAEVREHVSGWLGTLSRVIRPMDLIIGILAAASILAAVSPKIRRRCPVRHLARKGRSTAEISRQTYLAQDAVRSLLEPGGCAFPRRSQRGRSFRPARSSESRETSLRELEGETAEAGIP